MPENPYGWDENTRAIFEANTPDPDGLSGESVYASIERRVVAPIRNKLNYITKVLTLADQYDFRVYLMWKLEDDGAIQFAINCNDVFHWACADCEDITPDTLPVLEHAVKDSKDDGPMLYCARMRKMRPQGAMYKYIREEDRPLFDACGPLREVEFGNPHKHPSEEAQ